jgi:two-component system sensor histidine kinase RpfC
VGHIRRAFNTGQAYDYASRVARDRSTCHVTIVVKNGLNEDPLRLAGTLKRMDVLHNMRLVLVGDGCFGAYGEEASRYGYRAAVESPESVRDVMCAMHYVLPYDEGWQAAVPVAAGPGEPGPLRLRILVAEDNQTNQMVIARLLERAGHEVKVVGDGQEALGALRKEPFDVALLDLNMPVMGGLEAARRYLSETKGRRTIPLVALTADATLESRKTCEEAGITAYITKPFEMRKVISVLHGLAAQGAIPPMAKPMPRGTTTGDYAARSGLDEATIKEIESLGPTTDFVKNLVWVFIRDSEKRIREMEHAAERNDVKALCRAAHSLKGISGSIGALAAMEICDKLQRMGGTESMEERLSLVGDVKEEIVRVRKTLIRRISTSDRMPGEGSA